MSKFTPGPWEAKNIFNNWLVVNGEDMIIDIRSNKANAQLIAAAPDLCHAVKYALNAIEKHYIGGADINWHDTAQVLQKVLDKAKGRGLDESLR